MTKLLRAPAFADQVVILGRPRRPEPAEPLNSDVTETAQTDATEAVVTESAEAEPRFTYDEFRLRFDEELAEAREQALQAGLADGLEQGRTQAAAEYERQLSALSTLMASMHQALETHIEGISDLTIEVVYESVAKIMGERMIDRVSVISTVREIIRHAKDRSRLIARVAPQDFAWIEQERAKLIEGLNINEIEIVADERVQLGGCLLETPAGNLDGRLEIQLQQLRDALLNARSR